MSNEGSILLVEDDPDDRMLIRLAFERVGITNPLIVLSDGEAAQQYLRREGIYGGRDDFHLPELVLLDLAMPRVSGFEVLKWVRSQPELKHLPVVVLSGSSSPADVNRAYQLGADSFLAKPVDFYALALELKKIVDFWLQSDYQKVAA